MKRKVEDDEERGMKCGWEGEKVKGEKAEVMGLGEGKGEMRGSEGRSGGNV